MMIQRLIAIFGLLAMLAAACGSSDDATTADGAQLADDGDGDDANAAEISGDPDLDEPPDEISDALDEIDDNGSTGECMSDVVGVAITPAEGWLCRVLDQGLGGVDGFTMLTEGNDVNLTVTTPSPLESPCDLLGPFCDSATPIDLSDNFPDTVLVNIAATVTIFGTFKDGDAEIVITSVDALTDDEITLISAALDSAVPV